jgi:hypothetical protein
MNNSFYYINVDEISIVKLYNKSDRNFTPYSKRGGVIFQRKYAKKKRTLSNVGYFANEKVIDRKWEGIDMMKLYVSADMEGI